MVAPSTIVSVATFVYLNPENLGYDRRKMISSQRRFHSRGRSGGFRSLRNKWTASVLVGILAACGGESDRKEAGRREVVVYTALDQIYSEPILKAFESKTGIRARAVYDLEAAKTTGLVSRLMAERDRPRCDVFWNNEIVQTIRLKSEGVLDVYRSPNAESIPATFKDPEGTWTGFAARARVLAYNTDLVSDDDAPKTLSELLDPRWKGKLGMAYPLFGTTSTHAAVLFGWWGEEKARGFFEALHKNDVQILEGNMTACRAVADGELPIALTDTDDANLLQSQGRPLRWHLIDHDGEGALLIPNTVAVMKNGPNPDEARELVDFLLSPEVEERLAAARSAQIPLHPGVAAPPEVEAMARSRFMEVDFADAATRIESSADFLKALFAR